MEQLDLLRHAVASLDRLAIPSMLVGSFASSAYGEPRFTNDIDLVVDLRADKIRFFCDAFPAPAFYLSELAVRDAAKARLPFNVLHPSSGNKIDFMFPPDNAWGAAQLHRRRRITLAEGLEAFVARPEDVILGKMWYFAEGGSEKHLRDIAGILRAAGEAIDRVDLEQWAEKLGLADILRLAIDRESAS